MQNQVADMTELLQKVLQTQTSKEKELQALIDAKGGRAEVINNDPVLLELSIKYDEKGWDKEKTAKDGGDKKTLDVTLKAELQTSIDELVASVRLCASPTDRNLWTVCFMQTKLYSTRNSRPKRICSLTLWIIPLTKLSRPSAKVLTSV